MSEWKALYLEKPPINECIDVWVDSGDVTGRVCNCFYNTKNNKFWYWDYECKNKIQFYYDHATHWMPLPKPPQGE